MEVVCHFEKEIYITKILKQEISHPSLILDFGSFSFFLSLFLSLSVGIKLK